MSPGRGPRASIDVDAIWEKLGVAGVARETVVVAVAVTYAPSRKLRRSITEYRKVTTARYARLARAVREVAPVLAMDWLSRQAFGNAHHRAAAALTECEDALSDLVERFESSHALVVTPPHTPPFPDGTDPWTLSTKIECIRTLAQWITPHEIATLLVGGFGAPVQPSYAPRAKETLAQTIRRVENDVLPPLRRVQRRAAKR